MGGVLAYEMASQLQRDGQEVASLVLLDSTAPRPYDRLGHKDELTLIQTFAINFGLPVDISIPWDDFVILSSQEKLEHMLARARESGELPEEITIERVRRYFQIFKICYQALANYKPSKYQGSLLLLKASEPTRPQLDPDDTFYDRTFKKLHYFKQLFARKIWDRLRPTAYGWDKLEGVEVTSRWVEGDHFSVLTEENVDSLAETLRDELAEIS